MCVLLACRRKAHCLITNTPPRLTTDNLTFWLLRHPDRNWSYALRVVDSTPVESMEAFTAVSVNFRMSAADIRSSSYGDTTRSEHFCCFE